jgi:hypothetical protein
MFRPFEAIFRVSRAKGTCFTIGKDLGIMVSYCRRLNIIRNILTGIVFYSITYGNTKVCGNFLLMLSL